MHTLKKIDILFFIYLFISTFFLFLAWDVEGYSLELLLIRSCIVLFVILLIYLDAKIQNLTFHFFRSVYPLIFSGYFYSETVYYNKLIFTNIDPILFKIDTKLFGLQPSLEFSDFFSNKLFSELMYFGYFSFYLLIIGFTLYIFFKNRNYFSKAIFLLSTSLYIFYLIFSFIPSAGPQFFFSSPQNQLPEAYFFDKIIHFIQSIAEQPTGAFPSSHVSVSLIVLMMARKNALTFFKFALPFVILIFFATVYIKAHYAIDIISGIIVAPFLLYFSEFLFNLPHSDKQFSNRKLFYK